MNEEKSSKARMLMAVLTVAIGVGAAGYALTNSQASERTKTETASHGTADQPGAAESDSQLPTIAFTDEGFSQQTYEFPAGTPIQVQNKSRMNLEFSSGSHPTHTEHAELNMEVLKPGESGTFKPGGVGTYSFHDHLHDRYAGTLVIR